MSARTLLVTGAVALLLAPVLLGGPAVADPAPGVYVVTLDARPAASYDGGVPGLRATRPTHGARYDRTRPAVAAYTSWLLARQDLLLDVVGSPTVLYRYTTALDGFAVSLTGDQVLRLRAEPGVLGVERSTVQHVDSTPSVAAVPGRDGGVPRAGSGIVVGVVDSGVWPDNPSFAGLPDRTPGTAAGLPGFHGGCTAAPAWSVADCTSKIVSARWFVSGFGASNTAAADYLSPRDGSGHGSHAASVAVGDSGVRVQVDGQPFGTTSGMAPAARLAVYKACWTAPDPAQDGCTTADTVAAIDSAVADGVDVLSYSVSGSQVRDDAVERAFLGAASAGVFVAAAAGNVGPGAGTVDHVAPWVTTVAASTHHVFQGAVRLGNGAAFVGAMVSDRKVRSTRIVIGRTAAARHCEADSLDADRTDGAIVVCERGGGARVDKSASVASSGGVGMVLVNVRPEGVDADVHAVPSVHLGVADGAALIAYVRKAGRRATATLDPTGHDRTRVPAVADFSARGPATTSGGGVLKPDLTAPGVSILGAVAPPSDSGRSWDLASGTSSSAPHVAGLAAYVAGVHPDWSPARIKSALMTTARDLVGERSPLVEGAGDVDPTAVLDPGLVFDTSPAAWQRLAAGTERASDLNAPSVAVGDLVGTRTLTRRLTNVSSRTESYAVRVSGLRGIDVQAFPATVRLAPGQTRAVRLRITARPTVAVDRDVTGWLVWRGSRHRVRVPVSVRPAVVAAPTEVDGTGTTGRSLVRGRSGNGRTVKLLASGLVPARTSLLSLQPDDSQEVSVDVPEGTALARFASTADLSVFRGRRLVDSASAGQQVTLDDPRPGSYRVVVTARSTSDTGVPVRLDRWVVPAHGGRFLRLSTDAVGFAPGRRFAFDASWRGLRPDRSYLGVVSYGASRRTVLEVTT